MLTQVPEAMRKRNRLLVLNHPNAMDCELWRKVQKRTFGTGTSEIGGLPTLGGLAVLDNEDETEPEYVCMGEGKVLFLGIYERTTMHNSGDAAEQQDVSEALIEPKMIGAWAPKDSDLIQAYPGCGVVLPYEVTRELNTANIPPYAVKYELRSQGDLLFDSALATEFAER
jgi:hypothetical protein